MIEYNAIVLAAGMSQRMGAANKLLLDIGGMPLLARSLRAYVEGVSGGITLVTGYQRKEVEASVAHLPVTCLFNPEFEKGQQTSVVAGLSLPCEARATIVGLGDQPGLERADLQWLALQHEACPDKITIPVRPQGRGNPIIVPRSLGQAILTSPHAPGCREFTRTHPHLVNKVETDRRGFFEDVDSPEDYARMAAMQGGPHDLVH